jgi:cytochrome c oxidase subunit III
VSDATLNTRREEHETLSIRHLPQGSIGLGSAGWSGMMTLVVTEAALFSYLLFSYYYMALQFGRDWLPPELPSFRLSGPNTVILILSSVAVWFGEFGMKKDRRWICFAGLLAAFLLGCAFVGIQVKEWLDKPFTLSSDSYGSLFFVITGFHMAHVLAGLAILLALLIWTGLGLFDRHRHAPVSIGGIYWHFVDAVWLTVFFTFYVTPYLY